LTLHSRTGRCLNCRCKADRLCPLLIVAGVPIAAVRISAAEWLGSRRHRRQHDRTDLAGPAATASLCAPGSDFTTARWFAGQTAPHRVPRKIIVSHHCALRASAAAWNVTRSRYADRAVVPLDGDLLAHAPQRRGADWRRRVVGHFQLTHCRRRLRLWFSSLTPSGRPMALRTARTA
jgi:hypothetical protein